MIKQYTKYQINILMHEENIVENWFAGLPDGHAEGLSTQLFSSA